MIGYMMIRSSRRKSRLHHQQKTSFAAAIVREIFRTSFYLCPPLANELDGLCHVPDRLVGTRMGFEVSCRLRAHKPFNRRELCKYAKKAWSHRLAAL